MAMVKRVRRLANPRRRVNASIRKKAASGKKPMSAKQIKFFGTARQKAALKAARKRKRTLKAVGAATNPRRRKVARKRRTRKNPALVVTLGQLLNPTRRKKTMARRKRRVAKLNPRRRKTTVRRRRVVRRRRAVAVAANPRRRRRVIRRNPRRRVTRRRRNPDVFGSRPLSGGGIKLIAGGLVGVAAAKFLPRLIPSSITATMGNFGGVVATGISAYVASIAAGKFLGPQMGQAVLFGGLMQTGSVILNMVLPGFAVAGIPLALGGGLGELMPGSFVVPQNPLRLPAPMAPANARVNLNGLSRAFGNAF